MALDWFPNRKLSKYDGILVIADDAVPNYWNAALYNKSLHKVWTYHSHLAFDIDSVTLIILFFYFLNLKKNFKGNLCYRKDRNNTSDCSYVTNWLWTKRYDTEIHNFYEDLEHLVQSSSFWREKFQNLIKNSGGKRRLFRGAGDLFYIPSQFFDSIPKILQLFAR